MTIYDGLGELNSNYQKITMESVDSDVYTGFFTLFNLSSGSHLAVVESEDYLTNY